MPASACLEQSNNADAVASLEEVKWEHIHRVLLQCRGNIRVTARKLGLRQRTLQRKPATLRRSHDQPPEVTPLFPPGAAT